MIALSSCKKDSNDKLIFNAQERITEWLWIYEGEMTFKRQYSYDGDKMSEMLISRYDEKGEWLEFYKSCYEYSEAGKIIFQNYQYYDSAWQANYKGEFIVEDDKIIQSTSYQYSVIYPGNWEPAYHEQYTYDGNLLKEYIRDSYENQSWVRNSRITYNYINGQIALQTGYEYMSGGWEADEKTEYLYNHGVAYQVNDYHFDGGQWRKINKFLLNFSGSNLTRVEEYHFYNDSTILVGSMNIAYNEYGNPAIYTTNDGQTTEEVILTYEKGSGNH